MLKELKKEAIKAKKNNIKLVIHLHEYHNLHGLLIATLFKKEKIVAQHHGGSWPLKHLKQTKRYKFFFPFFFFAQLWESNVLKNISCFFALSEEEINYLNKVAPKSTIKFQTMGIEDIYFKEGNKKAARKKLKLPLNKKIILFIGRVNNVKGIPYLVDAMEKLQDFELKVIGWDQVEKFRNYAKSKNLKNVEFLGPVFDKRKFLYLDAADVFVLPSSKEGAPVSIMEAMAKNIPIVATNIGGVPLMIKEEKNGIIIRKKNSSDIVIAVRNIFKKPLKNVKKYAQVYRWKNIVKETIKEYLR
jgi:glycosyltransferase involved in cell wall biosynthesis